MRKIGKARITFVRAFSVLRKGWYPFGDERQNSLYERLAFSIGYTLNGRTIST